MTLLVILGVALLLLAVCSFWLHEADEPYELGPWPWETAQGAAAWCAVMGVLFLIPILWSLAVPVLAILFVAWALKGTVRRRDLHDVMMRWLRKPLPVEGDEAWCTWAQATQFEIFDSEMWPGVPNDAVSGFLKGKHDAYDMEHKLDERLGLKR